MFKACTVFGVVAPHRQFQPFRESIDDRNPHPVQTARDFVSVAGFVGVVEFATGVQLGHDDFGGRDALFLVHVDGDAAPVIAHRNRAVGVDFHADFGGMAGQGFVDAVIDNFIHHMVQARPVIGVANIHAGALTNSV